MSTRPHRVPRILSTLAAVGIAVSPLAALAQSFEARPVTAVLGEDAQTARKVPRGDGAITTADGRARYIVQLVDPPLALYAGGRSGIEATSPRVTGERKLDVRSPAAQAYSQVLAEAQSSFIADLASIEPGARVIRQYDVVLNGMAVAVRPGRVEAMRRLPGVAAVYPDRMQYASMDASLPLINAPALWAELGGRDDAGAGIIVGVIDSGIDPDNPMFSGDGFSYPDGFPLADDYCGTVDAGFCTGKLIAARHFLSFALHPDEIDSPQDVDAHGTHVAGTAVGNYVEGAAGPDGVAENISGVAPGAYLIAYKGLWWNGETGSGSTTDLIAAVNASVADGCDVVNNSWGGGGGEDPNSDAFGPVFEAAAAANVLHVVAAGNDGPAPRTIGCPGCQPPVLTVANSTTNRLHGLSFEATAPPPRRGSLPDAVVCLEGTGPLTGSTEGPKSLVYAGDVGDALGCSAFPASSMDGSIALISRGTCAFSTKVDNAAAAGADYAVVFNNGPGAPIVMGFLESTTIPSCMIDRATGESVSTFASSNPGTSATVTHPATRFTDEAWADLMSDSSSRGPNGDPNVFKPDIAAPGTNILSAWSPLAPDGPATAYNIISGTSMASPHVAGAAALLRQLHPSWDAEQVKSALSSSALPVLTKEDTVTMADPFDQGGGRLELDRARRAGATFDVANASIGGCVASCSFTRTIQSEVVPTRGGGNVTWTATVVKDDPDLVVDVTPSVVNLSTGGSAGFEVSFDTTGVEQGDWKFGYVIWTPSVGGVPEALVPFAVEAAASTDAAFVTKVVDVESADPGDRLSYDIALSNSTVTETIDLVDPLPAGMSYVAGSASVMIDGSPASGFDYDEGTNSMKWSGTLDTADVIVAAGSSPFGYVPLSAYFDPLPCSSQCDETSISLTGFAPFTFLGQTYTSVVMSSNGYLVVGDDDTPATYLNQELPDATAPNNVLAPFWTDLDLDGTAVDDPGNGTWYAGILNAGPYAWNIFEWTAASEWNNDANQFTFQIWIEAGTSNIHFVYADVTTVPSFVTVGAEDPTGTSGDSYYFDGAGTAPVAGVDLAVTTGAGGSAQFSYQLDVDDACTVGPFVNTVGVSGGAMDEEAFAAAASSCIFGDDFETEDLSGWSSSVP